MSLDARYAVLIFLMSFQAFADCGPVEVNCQTHQITIQGQSTKIDCGRGTHVNGSDDKTYDGTGTVGEPYVPQAAGDPVKNAVDIQVHAEPSFMGQKAMVEIASYEPSSMTYELTFLASKRQGPFLATPEQVSKGISTVLNKIRRDPSSIVGNQYMVDEPIRLLSDNEIDARKKAHRKSTGR